MLKKTKEAIMQQVKKDLQNFKNDRDFNKWMLNTAKKYKHAVINNLPWGLSSNSAHVAQNDGDGYGYYIKCFYPEQAAAFIETLIDTYLSINKTIEDGKEKESLRS